MDLELTTLYVYMSFWSSGGELPKLGNCNINAEQNILFVKFSLDWKFEFKKSFKTYLPNYVNGHNKSCQKFHSIWVAQMKPNVIQ